MLCASHKQITTHQKKMATAIAKEKSTAATRRRIRNKGGKPPTKPDPVAAAESDSSALASDASAVSDAVAATKKRKVKIAAPALAVKTKKVVDAAPGAASALAVKKKKVVDAAPGEYKPSFSCEWTRFQVLCRTGKKADPSVTFPFADYTNGVAGAHAAAVEWVANFKKEHGLA